MTSLHWFQFLISFALQAAIVTILACQIERRCKNATTKTRLWTSYYLCIIGLLATGALLPHLYWANPWQYLSDRNLIRVVHVENAAVVLLLCVWLLGIAWLAIRWAYGSRQLALFIRNCRHATPNELAVIQAATPTSLRRPDGHAVEFRILPDSIAPFCYQLHRPLVLLPRTVVIGNADDLRQILQHELTHLQTQHPVQVFIQRLVQTLLWFMPTIWTAGRLARLAREFVCDEAAVDGGESAARYLRMLLRYARCENTQDAAVLNAVRSPHELNVRAQRLASGDTAGDGRIMRFAPMLMLFLTLLVAQLWLPTHPLASAKSWCSPWPRWTAAVLHAFEIPVRDFDQFDSRLQLHDLEKGSNAASG
ncbi:M56 family metallopeptidase [Lacipirellula parvula]|uniref:Peptidase M56 domain-containing protein n=1 Tax=Lacipirellula parvula TaxID=2650471 RepID=A0A5K7X908_9BACT|nr:M56 family metallopeptidase [Lacipirellula parvula]BBO32825.1 hypothetical protein PLANPX_2437 [Lacipirellula parvula]